QENGAGGKQDNNIKTIITKSGHKIEFNDTPRSESITITDKKGNHVIIDTQNETISINALKDINITAGENINISAGKNIVVNAGENLEESIGKNKTSDIGENYSVIVAKELSLKSDSSTEIVNKEKMLVAKDILENAEKIRIESSKENLELVSSKQVDIQADDKIKLF
ncbi:MAG: DUF2345 domain-containing protein, partial [Flavobacteriaceae bacterium]|nr:DUF2345 domain-containing protein [Flavobacteriaceae bacterium]